MPKNETPAESSGRRVSRPWAPGEEDEARQAIRDAAASGPPYVIENLDDVRAEIVAASVKADGSVLLAIAFEGSVRRPTTESAISPVVVDVTVPAKTEGIEHG